MTSIVLVPWAATDWTESERLAARTPLPLSESGEETALDWANELAGRELTAVYCGSETTSRQMAKVLADQAEVRWKAVEALDEVDVGLWEGLTPAQIETRYPKLFKRWRDNPAAVSPPEGEQVGEAADRLMEAVTGITRKHRNGAVAIVMAPVALAATRSKFEHGQANMLHEIKTTEPVWYTFTDSLHEPVGASES